MTNRDKIIWAAEQIIEFGLDGTGWTAEEMRTAAKVETLNVNWSPTSESEILLRVEEYNDVVRVQIEAKMGKASPDQALTVADALSRVSSLAYRIEKTIAMMEAP